MISLLKISSIKLINCKKKTFVNNEKLEIIYPHAPLAMTSLTIYPLVHNALKNVFFFKESLEVPLEHNSTVITSGLISLSFVYGHKTRCLARFIELIIKELLI